MLVEHVDQIALNKQLHMSNWQRVVETEVSVLDVVETEGAALGEVVRDIRRHACVTGIHDAVRRSIRYAFSHIDRPDRGV